jgi:hypothetical protein
MVMFFHLRTYSYYISLIIENEIGSIFIISVYKLYKYCII